MGVSRPRFPRIWPVSLTHRTLSWLALRLEKSIMAQATAVSSKSDRLDQHTRYYRIVVWNRFGEVQWLIQCRPEREARHYAKGVNSTTRKTGFRASLRRIKLGVLPESLTSKVTKGGAE